MTENIASRTGHSIDRRRVTMAQDMLRPTALFEWICQRLEDSWLMFGADVESEFLAPLNDVDVASSMALS